MKKNTGIIRKIDELGRIVLPKELRRTFAITEKDPIEIYTEDDMIILKKWQNRCVFCHSEDNLIAYKGKFICKDCVKSL